MHDHLRAAHRSAFDSTCFTGAERRRGDGRIRCAPGLVGVAGAAPGQLAASKHEQPYWSCVHRQPSVRHICHRDEMKRAWSRLEDTAGPARRRGQAGRSSSTWAWDSEPRGMSHNGAGGLRGSGRNSRPDHTVINNDTSAAPVHAPADARHGRPQHAPVGCSSRPGQHADAVVCDGSAPRTETPQRAAGTAFTGDQRRRSSSR